MRNCRDWLGCGAKRLDAQGRQDKRKVLTAASESSRLVQSRCRGVELLNGTGTEAGDTVTTDIKLCSKKSRHGQTYRHLAYAQETNDRNKQNCPGKHQIRSLSMTRDRAYCPAIL